MRNEDAPRFSAAISGRQSPGSRLPVSGHRLRAPCSQLPIFLLAATLAALSFALSAEAPRPIPCQWDPGIHRLGDRVCLTASVPIPEAQFFVTGTLAPGTFWGDTRVADSQQVPPKATPGNLTLRITVQAFVVGPARLTPVPITVNTSKGSVEYLLQPPPLEIAALLMEGDGPPPPDPPIPYPRPFPWDLTLGVVGIATLAVAVARWAVLKARRRRLEPPPVPKPRETDPETWIREEVERIFRTDAEPRVKYGMLSQKLREYLLIRTALPFPDWTTDECSRGAIRSSLLGEAERERLSRSLKLCDLAKFAKYKPPPPEQEKARGDVKALLDGLGRNIEASRREGAA